MARSSSLYRFAFLCIGLLSTALIIFGPPLDPRPIMQSARPLFDLPTIAHVMLAAAIIATGAVTALELFTGASRADRAMRFRRFSLFGPDRYPLRYTS